MQVLKTPVRIGILGGGQLARMLALRAHSMGLCPYVISPRPDDPAAQVTQWWHRGDPNNKDDLTRFLRQVEVATFESEFLSASLLHEISGVVKTPIYPRPQLMEQIQDRSPQKRILLAHNIPTADFMDVQNPEELSAAAIKFKHSFVLKKRRFGYDGYGTYVIKSKAQMRWARELIREVPEGFIAEELVPFRRELAVVMARSRDGSVSAFPLVESLQRDSRCLWVKGPTRQSKWPSLRKKLLNLLQMLDYVGVMGIEIFDLGNRLLVNELAPRVHNSGHYSMDALSEDQFTQHLKGILGQRLLSPTPLQAGFAMFNLLGEGHRRFRWPLVPGVHLHWYGKHESRAGRKMGHLNATANHPTKALKKLIEARSQFKV